MYRIVIELPRPYKNNVHEENLLLAEKIKDGIIRHVDGIPDKGGIYTDWNMREICSYCNQSWEEDEDGQPLCCNGAVEEFEKKEKT